MVIFADQRHNDVKREMKKVHDKAEEMAYMKDFADLNQNFVSLKANLESDLDQIQSGVKTFQDSQAQIMKKFKLLEKKVDDFEPSAGGMYGMSMSQKVG